MDRKALGKIVDDLFAKYDLNKNGTIDVKQMQKFLTDAYTAAGKKPSNFAEAQDIIKNFDKNKDGVIDKA